MGTNVYTPDFLVGNCVGHSRVGLVGMRARDADPASPARNSRGAGTLHRVPVAVISTFNARRAASADLAAYSAGFPSPAPGRAASAELAASAQGPRRETGQAPPPVVRDSRCAGKCQPSLGARLRLPFQQSQLPAAGRPDLREFGSLERRCRRTSGAEFPGVPGAESPGAGRPVRPVSSGSDTDLRSPARNPCSPAKCQPGQGICFGCHLAEGWPRAGPSGPCPTDVLTLAGTAARPRPGDVAPVSGGDYLDTRRPSGGE
jgi:hypothetical protein